MRSTRAIVIHPENWFEVVTLVPGDAARLTQLQALVGGYIEGVAIYRPSPVHDGDRVIAYGYVNDEGKFNGLPRNDIATELVWPEGLDNTLGDWIVGSLVVVGSPDAGGNETDVPDAVLSWLLERGQS